MSHNKEFFDMLKFYLEENGFTASVQEGRWGGPLIAQDSLWNIEVHLKHGFGPEITVEMQPIHLMVNKNNIYTHKYRSDPTYASGMRNEPLGRLEDPDILEKIVKYCNFYMDRLKGRVDNGETV